MKEKNRYDHALWRIMEQMLEVESMEDALSGSLDIIMDTIGSEAGAVWLLDPQTNRLYPMFHRGPVDISGISIENGSGIEGVVTRTGKSVIIADTHSDARYDGSIFDDQGMDTKTMLCVPLSDPEKTIGCVQLINLKNGGQFDQDQLQLCERMASLAAITIAEKGLSIGDAEEKDILVSLSDVTKEFESGGETVKILKGINLNVYQGELLVVLGESGCGKSTMMNIIGGMDSLTNGTLMIEGKDYSHPSEAELTMYRRNYIGFVFQSYNLMPNLSAIDNVRFIAEICPDPLTPEEAIGLVGLTSRADNFPAQMSGGQQQRVAIARALVKNPKLILADEPTAALDYETSIEVLEAFERAVKTKHTTVIMITHNPEIGKMADRVVKLRSGRVFSIKKNAKPLKAAELEW